MKNLRYEEATGHTAFKWESGLRLGSRVHALDHYGLPHILFLHVLHLGGGYLVSTEYLLN